jgi:CheY-like chemotaxis protein
MSGVSGDAADQTRAMMERQIEHLVRLVDELLDVSRIVRGKVQLRPERLDLGQLVRVTAEDRRPVLEKAGLTLRLDTPDTPIWVHGDSTRLAQILNNLLDNAVKFSEGGKSVAVRVDVDTEGRQASLTVRDEGMGVDPAVVPRLFTPFAQADQSLERSSGGLGLGLALVKGLAELHGGRVECVSEGKGRGAEFTVRLPLMPEPAALASSSTGPPQPGENHLRVLVIEDHRDAADSLRILLEMLGHQVQVAYSGPDGVRAAAEWRPNIVLCDIGLPGLDGYGVARQLRLNPTTARVRLLALTGYGTDEARQRSREAGFDHHLVKPADPRELRRLLVPG